MEWHKLMLFCKKFSNRLAIRQICTTFAPGNHACYYGPRKP